MNVRSRIPVLLLSALVFTSFSLPVLWAQAAQPAPAPPPTDTGHQDSSRELSISVGKTAVIDFTSPVTRVAVGLGEVVEASAVSPTEILVNGKTPGTTTLIVWEQGGVRQFFNVTVHLNRFTTDDTLAGLRRQLNVELPGQDVHATSENGLIYLRGTVKDLISSDRAYQIANNVGKTVNMLYVNIPEAPAQILLKVRFCSVDRSLEKQLGLNFYTLGATNTIGQISTGQFSPPIVSDVAGSATAVSATQLPITIFRPDLSLGANIEALETKGLVESLAEPNLLAEDGKEASFLAGGEYPYPVVQGGSAGSAPTVTIQFKEFGIRLNFLPTLTPRGTIRLQLSPEVSSLDFTNAIEISGFNVPAIDVRRVKTEVELGEGQSFIIGGLLDNTENESFQKIPFLGDIPVLGKFFQSIQRTKNNSELIVIVTPVIVPPIPVGQPLPSLHYPVKFLAPNSTVPMYNPGGEAGAAPAANGAPATSTIPIETLIEYNKPEKPLSGAGSYQVGTGGSQ